MPLIASSPRFVTARSALMQGTTGVTSPVGS